MFAFSQYILIFSTSTTLLLLFPLLKKASMTHGSILSLRLNSGALSFKKAFLVPQVRCVLSCLRISGMQHLCISCAAHWEGTTEWDIGAGKGGRARPRQLRVSKKGGPGPCTRRYRSPWI